MVHEFRMPPAENGEGFSRTVPFNHDMAIESAGRWKLLCRPRASIEFRIAGIMPVEELEAYLNSIAVAATGGLGR